MAQAVKRPTLQALRSASASTSSRQFSSSSSKSDFAMQLPILDIFDAPARLEDLASRYLRPADTSRTSTSPVVPVRSRAYSSLPPPIVFDGPSGSRPKQYNSDARMVPHPGKPATVVKIFDGPARRGGASQRQRARFPGTPVIATMGAAIAAALFSTT